MYANDRYSASSTKIACATSTASRRRGFCRCAIVILRLYDNHDRIFLRVILREHVLHLRARQFLIALRLAHQLVERDAAEGELVEAAGPESRVLQLLVIGDRELLFGDVHF